MNNAACWHECNTRDALSSNVATLMVETVQQKLRHQKTVLLGLAGGSTPMAAYTQFAQSALPWSSVQLALVDERFVPPTHADSNEGRIRAALADCVTQLNCFCGLWHADENLTQAAESASTCIQSLHLPFDLLVLGMGEDGHIASLFTGATRYADAMNITSEYTVLPMQFNQAADADKCSRLSLTVAVLMRAQRIALMISGTKKYQVAQQASKQPDTMRLPVSLLFQSGAPPLDIFWSR